MNVTVNIGDQTVDSPLQNATSLRDEPPQDGGQAPLLDAAFATSQNLLSEDAGGPPSWLLDAISEAQAIGNISSDQQPDSASSADAGPGPVL
jgi:hypothetical protein